LFNFDIQADKCSINWRSNFRFYWVNINCS